MGVKTPINCNCREQSGQIICDQCDPCTSVICPIPEPQAEPTPEPTPEAELVAEVVSEAGPEPQAEQIPEPEPTVEVTPEAGQEVQPEEIVMEAQPELAAESTPESEPVTEPVLEAGPEATPEEMTEPQIETLPEQTCSLSFVNLMNTQGVTIPVPSDFANYVYQGIERQVVAHDPCNNRVFWKGSEAWSWSADTVNLNGVYSEFGKKPSSNGMTVPVMCPINFGTIVNGNETYYYVYVPDMSSGGKHDLMAFRKSTSTCGTSSGYMWYWEPGVGSTKLIRITVYMPLANNGNWAELLQ